MLQTQNETNFNIKSLIVPVITTVIAALSGALVAGAVGSAFAFYGAAIGGVIGCVLSTLIDDLPQEISITIGVIIGAVFGIITAKSKETEGIDNDNYLKGAECAGKLVLKHLDNATRCGKMNIDSCKEVLKGADELIDCMGGNVEPPVELA